MESCKSAMVAARARANQYADVGLRGRYRVNALICVIYSGCADYVMLEKLDWR